MRAIAGLFGLALLAICPLASAQSPVVVTAAQEPIANDLEPGFTLEPETQLGPFGYAPVVYAPHEGGVWMGEDYSPRGNEWWCQSWYLRVEALLLQRTRGFDERVIVETDAGLPLLATGDFSFELRPGISALVGHRLDSASSWELQYFGAHQWDETRTVASLNNLDFPDPLGGIADDFNNADIITAQFQSFLHNVEANYFRDHDGASWLIGFRYVNWEERLVLTTTDNDGDVSDYDLGTSNNLLGAQIGARVARYDRHWDMELTGKAGIFGNDVVQRQSLLDDDGAVLLRHVSTRHGGAAFVGDVNLSAHFRLSELWSLRAGYNVMLISGLALVPDQLDFTNGLLSGTSIDRDGVVFLHGLNVGFEAVW